MPDASVGRRCSWPMFQTIVFSSSSGTQAMQLFFSGSTPGAFIVQNGSRKWPVRQ